MRRFRKIFGVIIIAALVSVDTNAQNNQAGTVQPENFSNKTWYVEFDTVSLYFTMKFRDNSKPLTTGQVLVLLNEKYPDIPVELDKISYDTVFVKIDNSSVLTQQSGTAGADAFLATVIYNLSEFRNITCVNFDFEPGDHAVPGTYSREDFIEF